MYTNYHTIQSTEYLSKICLDQTDSAEYWQMPDAEIVPSLLQKPEINKMS